MLRFESAPDHVIAVRLSGTVTKQDVMAMEHAVKDKLARHAKVGLLFDLSGLMDVTGEAVVEDFKFEVGMLGKLNRFPRVAVVSDKRWIAVVARVVGAIVPMVKVKSFTPDEWDQAMAFAAEAR